LRRGRPPGGYWPEFRNREAELWHPLLTIARVCGPDTERRALEAARSMSRAKQSIQADERHIAQGRELVEVLRGMDCQRFRPADVLKSLEESETWAEPLAEKRDERAKAALVGQYLRRFRLRSHSRCRTGSTYDRVETMDVIGRHIPPTQVEATATSATSATDYANTATSDVANATSRMVSGSSSKHAPCGSVAEVAEKPRPKEEL